MKIKFRQRRESRDVYPRVPRYPWRILNRKAIVFRIGVPIQNDIISHLRNIESPIHFSFVVPWHGILRSATLLTKIAAEKISGSKRIASRTADHASPSKSDFQNREGLNVEFLPVHERSRHVRMAFKTAKELVDSNGSQIPQKARQTERLGVHQPHHIHWVNVVTPRQRIGSWSPRKTLPT